MDYNNQRNVFYSRPQMPQPPQPPYMNTNGRFSYNTLPVMNPMFDHQMMSDQMMADRVSMSSCGRGEVAGRNEMCMWEPKREARKEVCGEVKSEMKCPPRCMPRCEPKCEPKCMPKCEPKCEPKCMPKCEPKREPKCEPKCEVKSDVKSEIEITPVCETKCETKCKTKCETKCDKEATMGSNISPATMMGCDDMPIAMAYVPWQKWGPTYPIDLGLKRGTIFPNLDLPFEMGRCR